MGARLLERHLTLDRTMRGPDHKASLEPAQFADQVRALREVEAVAGRPASLDHARRNAQPARARQEPGRGDGHSGAHGDRARHAHQQESGARAVAAVHRQAGRPAAGARGGARRNVPAVGHRRSGRPRRDETAIDVGAPWGIVARFLDFAPLERAFVPLGMRFVEFHVSDRDLDAGAAAYLGGRKPFGFVVHAPEYAHDTLIDLCAADDAQRQLSVQRIQKTIDLARGARAAVRLGCRAVPARPEDRHARRRHVAAARRLRRRGGHRPLLGALRQLDTAGVDLLLENLPPYPWYFGGRWFGHVICDSENTVLLCRESGLGLCFDTSHAALECARSGASLLEFAQAVAPLRAPPAPVRRRRHVR